MSKKIGIVEYKNLISKDNNVPIGHGFKVLWEAERYVSSMGYDISVFASKEYKGHQGYTNYENYSFKRSFKELLNILKALYTLKKCDVLWFTNVDWVLFLALCLVNVRNKIVISEYCDNETIISKIDGNHKLLGSLVKKLCLKGLGKINLKIRSYTREETEDCLYVPDFIYSNKYEKYQSDKKTIDILVIGLINNVTKDIEGAFRVFKNTKYNLLIHGYFTDKDFKERILCEKTNNIVVIDEEIEEEQYLTEIGQAKYVLVPSRMDKYRDATSGVLTEALYIHTPVIAPNKLLENMNVDGYGYQEIDDIIGMLNKGINFPSSFGKQEEIVYFEKLKRAFEKI